MDIEKVLNAIKTIRAGTPKLRKHFSDMVEERELDRSEVERTWREASVVGLVHQGQDVYKITFDFKKDKDLNIIIGVTDEKEIRLISIFPTDIIRRVKHGKK